MKKIPTLFERSLDGDHKVIDKLVEGCEWISEPEVTCSEKFDGTAVMWDGSQLWKRYTAKPNQALPMEFRIAGDADPETGKLPGWLPVGNEPEDAYFLEAFAASPDLLPGTYELVGALVQGNPYKLAGHELWKHGKNLLDDVPTTFEELRQYFIDNMLEGVVWLHPDGRMAKLKAKDFGITWNTHN